MSFAKLYEYEDIGQVIVMIQESNEGKPEVRFFVEPEGLGVCSLAATFRDADKGWDQCGELFEKVDSNIARKSVQPLIDAAAEI